MVSKLAIATLVAVVVCHLALATDPQSTTEPTSRAPARFYRHAETAAPQPDEQHTGAPTHPQPAPITTEHILANLPEIKDEHDHSANHTTPTYYR